MVDHTRVDQIAARLRAGVDIKERRFRLKTYPATFLGTDAVSFLIESEKVSTSEALKLGNLLIREKIFHHVCDDHLLENGKLFYRFYKDEENLKSKVLTKSNEQPENEKTKTSSVKESNNNTGARANKKSDFKSTLTTQQQLIQLRLSVDRGLSDAEAERKHMQLQFEGIMYEYERSIRTLLRVVLVLSVILLFVAAWQLFVAASGFMSSWWGHLFVMLCVAYGISTVKNSAQSVASRHGVESLIHLITGQTMNSTNTITADTNTDTNTIQRSAQSLIIGSTKGGKRNHSSTTNTMRAKRTKSTTTITSSSKSSVDNAIELIPSSLDVSKLLIEHAVEIRKLQKLAPVPQIQDPYLQYDDIFYLRYILSFGSAEKAKDPVEYTFKFRSATKFQNLAKKLDNDEFLQLPGVVEAKKWQVGAPLEGVLTKETGGGVAVMIRMGLCNMSMMHDRISKDDMYEMNLGQREGAYQLCDRLTRKTGMLCKQSMFMDMNGATLSSMMDRRQGNTHAEMSKISSRLYPQLMDKFCILNAPSWMGWFMSIYKKIGSKRSIAKFELFTSTEQMWSSAWAKERLIRANFPYFVGGDVPEEKLSDDLNGNDLQIDPLPQLIVGARSKETVEIEIVESSTSTSDATSDSTSTSTSTSLSSSISIQYCFHLVKSSLEYRVTFEPSDGSSNIIVVRERETVKAEDGPRNGVWNVETQGIPGIIKVEFDNSSSTWSSKTVMYSFDVQIKEQ